MRQHRRTLVVLFATFALSSAACSKSSNGVTNSPSSSGSANNTIPPTGVIGQPTATLGSGGTLPTTTPGGATGSFNSGSAKVTVSGGATASLDLPTLSSGIFAPPPGGMALVWNDNSGQALGMGGPSFTGSSKTASDLVLTFGLLSSGAGGFEQFTSSKGECTIKLDTAEAGNVAGSFECSGVTGSNGTTADASGTFEASA